MSLRRIRSFVLTLAVASFTLSTVVAPAHAGMIDTQTAVAAADRDSQMARIGAVLDRAEVRDRLESMGVDRAAADARIAALGDLELARLADDLEHAPAGADALALVGAVFVVLLILELTGVIDVFKKV